MTSIFRQDEVARTENFDGAKRYVAKVSNRRCDDENRPNASARRPAHRASAENVDVNMGDGLIRVSTIVHNRPVAGLRDAFVARDASRNQREMSG